jgi:hypothetical protein
MTEIELLMHFDIYWKMHNNDEYEDDEKDRLVECLLCSEYYHSIIGHNPQYENVLMKFKEWMHPFIRIWKINNLFSD